MLLRISPPLARSRFRRDRWRGSWLTLSIILALLGPMIALGGCTRPAERKPASRWVRAEVLYYGWDLPPGSEPITLNEPGEVAELASFFPGLGELKRGLDAAGWDGTLYITFHTVEGQTLATEASPMADRPEESFWREDGRGDYLLRDPAGLVTFLQQLAPRPRATERADWPGPLDESLLIGAWYQRLVPIGGETAVQDVLILREDRTWLKATVHGELGDPTHVTHATLGTPWSAQAEDPDQPHPIARLALDQPNQEAARFISLAAVTPEQFVGLPVLGGPPLTRYRRAEQTVEQMADLIVQALPAREAAPLREALEDRENVEPPSDRRGGQDTWPSPFDESMLIGAWYWDHRGGGAVPVQDVLVLREDHVWLRATVHGELAEPERIENLVSGGRWSVAVITLDDGQPFVGGATLRLTHPGADLVEDMPIAAVTPDQIVGTPTHETITITPRYRRAELGMAQVEDVLNGSPATAVPGRAGEGPVQSDWSAPVEGVQIRVRAAKPVWRADEIPELWWDVRNIGERQHLRVAEGQRYVQLEVDGEWHQWPAALQGARLADLPAGRSLADQRVTVSPIWSRARPEDLQWRRDGFRVVRETDRSSLQFQAGRRTVRLAVIVEPSRAHTGEGFRVVSEPLEIEIEAAPADHAQGWPPGPEVAHALKQALISTTSVLQQYLHSAPEMPDRIAQALAHTQEAAELAEGGPLHASVARMMDALVALQAAVQRDPADAAGAFSKAGEAYRHLVRVFAGELLSAESIDDENGASE